MPVPFYYHFGFHVATALFSFWAGVTPDQGVLTFGQILNACVSLSLYRLGLVLWKDEKAALAAALLAGFVSQMPGYYAAWGRYTLLAGMVLLPLAMAAALEIKEGLLRKQSLILMGFFLSGLVLTHYFAAFLFLMFWMILWVAAILEAQLFKRPGGATTTLVIGLGIGLLPASPWIYRGLGYGWDYLRLKIVSPAQPLGQAFFSDYGAYLIYLLGPWRNVILLFLAALGLGQAWRYKATRAFGLWAILLGLGVIPWGVHPMPFRPDHLAIVLFVPVSLLAGWSLFQMILKWKKTGLLLMTVLFFWGLGGTWNLVRPDTILADRADLQALCWIESNIPKGARFLINVTPWAWGTYRAVDGGAWITAMTGRETIVPPISYGFGKKDYKVEVNRLAALISRLEGCSPVFKEFVKENQISHVYLKSGVGTLKADDMLDCSGIQRSYDKGGILIYQVIPEKHFY
jgi:hypothetical protein